MIRLKYNNQNGKTTWALLLGTLFLALPFGSAGIDSLKLKLFSKDDFTKVVNKEFDISNRGTVELKNAHGEIKIETNESDKVEVEVIISVLAKSEDAAEEVFDRIDLDFQNSEDWVKAETRINSVKSTWKKWLNWGNDNTSFTIDYNVKMPKTCKLELNNRHGNSFVDEVEGQVKVEIRHGNIRLEGVSNSIEVDVAHGNITIGKALDLDGIVRHGKLKLKEANNVDIESSYSHIYIDEAKEVKSNSKYDTYKIGLINDFRNTGKYDNFEIESARTISTISKYSDFEIESLSSSGDFEMEYSGVDIATVASEFDHLTVEGTHTEYKMHVDDGASYKLDVVGEFSGVRYPSGMDVVFEKEKVGSHELEAYQGGKNASSVIKARLTHGGIKIW